MKSTLFHWSSKHARGLPRDLGEVDRPVFSAMFWYFTALMTVLSVVQGKTEFVL